MSRTLDCVIFVVQWLQNAILLYNSKLAYNLKAKAGFSLVMSRR